MPLRIAALALLLLAGIPLAARAWSKPNHQIFLTVQVIEETGDSKPARHIDQTILVDKDGAFSSFSGGEWPEEKLMAARRFGTRISGSINYDSRQIDINLDFSSRVFPDGSVDTESRVILGQYIDIQTKLTPGVTSRLHCGGQFWCELTLQTSPDR
jgi:hypothetical protein